MPAARLPRPWRPFAAAASAPLMRHARAIVLIAIVCAGCVSKPRASQPSEPVAGLKRATERPQYTSGQIIQLYLANIAFGDWYLARLAAACDELARDATTP